MACDRQRLMEPHLESAVIAVVRRMVLQGLRQHRSDRPVPLEMVATAWSWAVYGAAQEWVRTPKRPRAEDIVGPLVTLVSPLLGINSEDMDLARHYLVEEKVGQVS